MSAVADVFLLIRRENKNMKIIKQGITKEEAVSQKEQKIKKIEEQMKKQMLDITKDEITCRECGSVIKAEPEDIKKDRLFEYLVCPNCESEIGYWSLVQQ